MSAKKRLDTLRVLVGASAPLNSHADYSALLGEINLIEAAAKVPKHNGWLLRMLHTTRTLDSSLRIVVESKGWLGDKQSLGAYLIELRKQSVISKQAQDMWHERIVKVRNRYMHRAGAMPTEQQTDAVLSEMQACLAVVLAKV